MVSTIGTDGGLNLAPFSFFNLVSTAPPVAMISIDLADDGQEKDTSANLRESGECVINMVSEELAERMVHASLDWHQSVNEFEAARLEAVPAALVGPPRVADSPVSLECRTIDSIALPASTAYFVEVLMIHARDSALDRGRLHSKALGIVGRLGGPNYCSTWPTRSIPRENPPAIPRDLPSP